MEMEIKIKTNSWSETNAVYDLARGVYHHLDKDDGEIDITYENNILDDDYDSYVLLTITKTTYTSICKLHTLMDLVKTFTKAEI